MFFQNLRIFEKSSFCRSRKKCSMVSNLSRAGRRFLFRTISESFQYFVLKQSIMIKIRNTQFYKDQLLV